MTDDLAEILANHPLVAAVRRSLRRMRIGAGGIVVAVSGGPDSVALLTALSTLDVSLVVGHVNHHLRGPQSADDEAFVAKFAEQLSLPFRAYDAPLPIGASIEACARELRYDKLIQMAQSCSFQTIATAHTLDDQAETVIMRLMRGTGLVGLGGIPTSRRWRGIQIVRPLLKLRRAVVLDYLCTAGLAYRVDSSNEDLHFTRNKVRKQIMPILVESGHPLLVERLGRLSEEARRLRRFVVRQAVLDAGACELDKAGPWIVFDSAKMSTLSTDRLCAVWRMAWCREGWPTGEMTRRHWRRLAELALGRVNAMDCPGGIRARRVDRIVRAGPGA